MTFEFGSEVNLALHSSFNVLLHYMYKTYGMFIYMSYIFLNSFMFKSFCKN